MMDKRESAQPKQGEGYVVRMPGCRMLEEVLIRGDGRRGIAHYETEEIPEGSECITPEVMCLLVLSATALKLMSMGVDISRIDLASLVDGDARIGFDGVRVPREIVERRFP